VWDDESLFRQTKTALEGTNDFRGTVYMSLADHPQSKDATVKIFDKAVREFAALLQAHQTESFAARYSISKLKTMGRCLCPGD